MEMVKDVPKDPNAKVVYRCDRCGIEADKPGECPHHCGGTLVVKE
jgi:DNA-directed RNA polymerase subunit RPC12/RpoP